MTPVAQPVNRYPLYLSPGISDQWVLTGCRFLGTSMENHFRSSFLFLPNPFDRTFPHPFNTSQSPEKHRGAVCRFRLYNTCEVPTLILVTALTTLSCRAVVIQRTRLNLTARRLVLVNGAESTKGRLTYYSFCMTSSLRPSGAKHGAIFAVMV